MNNCVLFWVGEGRGEALQKTNFLIQVFLATNNVMFVEYHV